MQLHWKGVNVDTGFATIGDAPSRGAFAPPPIRHEMNIIACDLHCRAIRDFRLGRPRFVELG
jgi:hypothetical protein